MIGKKKYKTVYARKEKSILPLLLGGGVLIYFLFFRNKSAATVTTQPGTMLPDPGTTAVNTGEGLPSYQPPAGVIIPVGENLPALDTTATSDRAVLLRDAAAYPDLIAALKQMNSTEIQAAYQYFYGYYLPGVVLYSAPVHSSDGVGWDYSAQYNATLYNSVQALKNKYHIF